MSVKDTIRIVQFDTEGTLLHETITSGTTVALLQVLDMSLKEASRTITDVRGMAVLVGIGSFTSTRIAVTVVNAIVYANQICARATTAADHADLPNIARLLIEARPGQYISATYSGVPRIGNISQH